MSLNKAAFDRVIDLAKVKVPPGDEGAFLNGMLKLLGKWRSQLVANTLIQKYGPVVQTGPFAGMQYVGLAAEGALAPRLLGTYESELHAHIRQILTTEPTTIVDIGCAEGYYAVGLARLAPQARIYAFDIDETAKSACTSLAEMNNVQDRVFVDGELTPDKLEQLCGDHTFIFCDIEGGEAELLNPGKAPSLARCSVIVETHPNAKPGVTQLLKSRFDSTHTICEVHETVKDVPSDHWLNTLTIQDRFIATWEWRSNPTPWLVMTPKPLD